MARVYNFSAGPAMLPIEVLKEAQEEMAAAENAIRTLGGELLQKHDFILGEAGERSIIEIKKIVTTPDAYPRRSKHIKNKPL